MKDREKEKENFSKIWCFLGTGEPAGLSSMWSHRVGHHWSDLAAAAAGGANRASLVVQMVKNPPAMQEARVRSLGWEDLLEEGMATHICIFGWRIPWTEEPGRLQSIESQSQTWLSHYAQHSTRAKKRSNGWSWVRKPKWGAKYEWKDEQLPHQQGLVGYYVERVEVGFHENFSSSSRLGSLVVFYFSNF